MTQLQPDSLYTRIYKIVRKIPKGRVASYGQVAHKAGLPGHARQVGYAMHALPVDSEIPWHRVVNAKGAISARRSGVGEQLQRRLLEKEGVVFDDKGCVKLKKFWWG